MFPNRRHLPAAILLALSVSWCGAAAASQDTSVSIDAEPAPAQSVTSPTTPQQVKDLSAIKVEQRFHEGGRALYQDEQRYAPVVTEVLGAEQISRTGDSDAGTTLKRVTGLTLLKGKYVYVRGLGAWAAETE